MNTRSARPRALVTGASRQRGIAAAIVASLAVDGWDVAFTHWTASDAETPGKAEPDGPAAIARSVRAAGGRSVDVALDLADAGAVPKLFDLVERDLGSVSALVVAHTHCVVTDTMTTTAESFDRHYAVNVRGVWALIHEFGKRFQPRDEGGRVVTLTSDHVVGNLPYGATKATADRLTLAAAHDLAPLGVTANAVNPGPVDTGWMTDAHRADAAARTPLARAATTTDTANLIRFLCSPQGGWISAQLLYSNGGMTSSIP